MALLTQLVLPYLSSTHELHAITHKRQNLWNHWKLIKRRQNLFFPSWRSYNDAPSPRHRNHDLQQCPHPTDWNAWLLNVQLEYSIGFEINDTEDFEVILKFLYRFYGEIKNAAPPAPCTHAFPDPSPPSTHPTQIDPASHKDAFTNVPLDTQSFLDLYHWPKTTLHAKQPPDDWRQRTEKTLREGYERAQIQAGSASTQQWRHRAPPVILIFCNCEEPTVSPKALLDLGKKLNTLRLLCLKLEDETFRVHVFYQPEATAKGLLSRILSISSSSKRGGTLKEVIEQALAAKRMPTPIRDAGNDPSNPPECNGAESQRLCSGATPS